MRLTSMRIAPFLLVLAGCAAVPPAAAPQASPLAGRIAGETRTCISSSEAQSPMVLDRQTIAYRSGRTLWVNRLRAACHNLEPVNTIVVESAGGQLCRGDRIRVIDHPMSIPGPSCALGDFTAYRAR